ncbi:hypothetical protein UFOVP161_26 [uncultured Caudovirales phage]|uniref:Uncharacterized protein n=1 Tax=uncultured Caudovirales phage TaxID=2100421 RepID=A0A6J7WDC9_9CAUD|nr:hypothetical protein UFOVP161_26 [uncultured Caudovirales phage]
MKTLNSNDIIDVRGLIERYEELVNLLDINAHEVLPGSSEELEELRAERASLAAILDELMGNGGDEEWRGDWYPQTLVRDSYFKTYAQELLEDCGDIPRDLPAYIQIDWQATARNIRVDYTPCEIDGITYWYR